MAWWDEWFEYEEDDDSYELSLQLRQVTLKKHLTSSFQAGACCSSLTINFTDMTWIAENDDLHDGAEVLAEGTLKCFFLGM